MAGRARAALNNLQLEDHSWKKYADCEYCDRTIMVNNYDDRKSRTPRFLGLVICPWCDPRHPDDRVLWMRDTKGDRPRMTYPVLYRTIISTWLIRQMVRGVPAGKIADQARKFWNLDGSPIPRGKANTDPTTRSDAEIYASAGRR